MTRQPNTKTQAYASAFYNHCLDNSTETVNNGVVVNVWKGFIGATCKELGIPDSMVRKVVKPLEVMGCITVNQRGVGGWPTVLVLHFPPTEDLWLSSDAPSALTRRSTYDTLIQDVKDLKDSIGGGNVVSALAALETRIKAIEQQLRKGSYGT